MRHAIYDVKHSTLTQVAPCALSECQQSDIQSTSIPNAHNVGTHPAYKGLTNAHNNGGGGISIILK